MRIAPGTVAVTLATSLLAATVFTACGGGGSAGGSPAVPPTSGVSVTVPTAAPSSVASPGASASPSSGPSASPSTSPSHGPTAAPSVAPSTAPTPSPSPSPSPSPVTNPASAQVQLTDNPALIYGDSTYFGLAAAPAATPIDGLLCAGVFNTTAQHFHAHFTLIVNGKQYAIPVAIGIHHPKKLPISGGGTPNPNPLVGFYEIDPGDRTSCHYDIHVHAADGVIHVESLNAAQTFSLKNFLDIWGVSLSTTGFWRFTGPTRWFQTDESAGPPGSFHVQEITGVDPATIQLRRHVEYTVEVGTPAAPVQNYNFVESQLGGTP